MENETKKGAMEEYIVNELVATKQELATLKEDYDNLKLVYNKLVEIVKLGTCGIKVEESSNENLQHINILQHYVCTIFTEHSKEDVLMQQFIKLVELGHTLGLVEREGE